MLIDIEVRDRTAVLAPHGRLDVLSAEAFKARIRESVETGATRVVVDLADVPFVDSSGLGALIAGLRTATRFGGDVRLARPQPEVRDVLELTRLTRLFELFDSVDAALAATGKSG